MTLIWSSGYCAICQTPHERQREGDLDPALPLVHPTQKAKHTMTTSNSRLIPITDDRARCLLPADDLFEPEPGSVLLVNGRFGQAWQRRFDDGLWHSTGGGRGRTWAHMLTYRNLVLIYDAEPRPTSMPRTSSSLADRLPR